MLSVNWGNQKALAVIPVCAMEIQSGVAEILWITHAQVFGFCALRRSGRV
jgi:hypothetical protein